MTKTLTISVPDTNNDDNISISGTFSDAGFNRVIVITVGNNKIAIDSEEFAKALSEVVDFQTHKIPISAAELYDGVEKKVETNGQS